MRENPHRRARWNLDDAARQLRMPVRALAERVQRGEITTERLGSYNFIAVNEVDRFAAVLRDEAKDAQAAEQEREAREKRETDGAFIVREMSHIRELAESYGFDPSEG